MFRATFAHLQERKTEGFFTTYGIVPVVVVGRDSERGNVALCVRYEGSCLSAPEDGQKFARNMLSWSWRSIKLLLLHLAGFCITLPTYTNTFIRSVQRA